MIHSDGSVFLFTLKSTTSNDPHPMGSFTAAWDYFHVIVPQGVLPTKMPNPVVPQCLAHKDPVAGQTGSLNCTWVWLTNTHTHTTGWRTGANPAQNNKQWVILKRASKTQVKLLPRHFLVILLRPLPPRLTLDNVLSNTERLKKSKPAAVSNTQQLPHPWKTKRYPHQATVIGFLTSNPRQFGRTNTLFRPLISSLLPRTYLVRIYPRSLIFNWRSQ